MLKLLKTSLDDIDDTRQIEKRRFSVRTQKINGKFANKNEHTYLRTNQSTLSLC